MEFGSMEDLERRLKEYRSGKGIASTSAGRVEPVISQSSQLRAYEGIIPSEAYKQDGRSDDPVQRKIDAYLRKSYVVQVSPEFAKYESVTTDLRPVKYDFLDKELMGRAGIVLERYDNKFIAELGRSVIPMMSSGFSKMGMAALFVLAYHLKKPGRWSDDYLLPDASQLEEFADNRYEEYSDRVISVCGPIQTITATHKYNAAKEASVYAYVAASMLRLFTKSPSNYIRAFNHIVDGYSRFYGEPADVQLPTPAEAAMRTLSDWFSFDSRAKTTLYRILYLSNGDQEGAGLKNFLYDIHLSYTGMHIVDILVRLCEVLNCSPRLVMKIINTGETARQVSCLVRLMDILEDTSKDRERRMWRYGRVFDETFMADIQTKTCPKLVYIMAAALQFEDPKTNMGILDIVQLGDVSPKIKCCVKKLQHGY
ncbi:hypothetical protein Scep_029238 [Stephania cephalantha]|uniref:Nucleoprotein n=1 Tax=Stephania cephalantha TaxID=152367 RepID=A0AAP0HFF0_9MAGN